MGVFVFVDMQIGVERIIFFVEKMIAMKLFRVWLFFFNLFDENIIFIYSNFLVN